MFKFVIAKVSVRLVDVIINNIKNENIRSFIYYLQFNKRFIKLILISVPNSKEP